MVCTLREGLTSCRENLWQPRRGWSLLTWLWGMSADKQMTGPQRPCPDMERRDLGAITVSSLETSALPLSPTAPLLLSLRFSGR